MRITYHFMRILCLGILCHLFLSISVNGQVPIPNPRDTFSGYPVVPYKYPPSDWKEIVKVYDIESIVEKRSDALGFYNLMVNISEPSTISGFTNATINIDNYQKKPFALDADIQAPIAIGGKKWFGRYGGMHTIHFIPQFKVRIFMDDDDAPGSPDGKVRGDTSLPVRTPSYMPRITYYRTGSRLWKKEGKSKREESWVISQFLGFSVFHHSNGQDGPEFYPDSTINVYSGNFGEQAVFEIIYGGVIDFNRTDDRDSREVKTEKKRDNFSKTFRLDTFSQNYPYTRRWYWRVGVELHPNALTNQDFKDYNLYGQYRLNLQSGFSWIPAFRDLILKKEKRCWIQTTPYQSKESFRIVGNLQYILDLNYNDGDQKTQEAVPYLDLRRLNLYGTIYWRMAGSPNAALFLQAGYWGSDLYNIYFQEQIVNFRLGLALAFFKYPKLADFQRESYGK